MANWTCDVFNVVWSLHQLIMNIMMRSYLQNPSNIPVRRPFLRLDSLPLVAYSTQLQLHNLEHKVYWITKVLLYRYIIYIYHNNNTFYNKIYQHSTIIPLDWVLTSAVGWRHILIYYSLRGPFSYINHNFKHNTYNASPYI